MIDLNVRLDSSLIDEDYRYLARLQQLEYTELQPLVFTDHHQEDYEEAREKALSLLQKEEAIDFALKSLIHRLYRDGYYYVEIGITPYLHTKGGLTIGRILKVVRHALYDALDKCPDMEVGLIIYCHRSANYRENLSVVDRVLKLKDPHIVALGLEGDDKGHTLASFKRLFNGPKLMNFPIVIELSHKYDSHSTILNAINLGAKRIISPYKLAIDNEIGFTLRKNNVYLEYRPSFDVINGYIEKMEDLPLKQAWMKGIPAYVVGCAYGICDASLKREFTHLKYHNEFTREDIQQSISLSISASFASLKEKNRMVNYFVKNFNSFNNNI